MPRLRRVLVLVAVALAAIGGIALARLDRQVRAYLAGPALGAVRIYAAPTVLRRDAPVPGGSLARKLARLGYRQAAGDALVAGSYRAAGGAVEIAPRPSPAPWAPAPRPARVAVQGRRVADIRAADGTPLDTLDLEPEVLATLGRSGGALDAGADPAPPACRAAVLAAEDRHFFHHPGIDPTAIARALLADLRAGGRRQGGSTISQQLAKNVFLTPRRTLGRKAREAVLALLLEAHATKEEILRRYLASVYLGEDGAVPIHGFAEAADAYFAKPLGELGPAECALLAGIIRSPNGLAPRQHATAALARRNRVLTAMVEDGALDQAAGQRARGEPLRLAPPHARPVGALYVADEVARELGRLLPPDAARAPGLAVFTAVDADAQREAERAVRRRLEASDRARARRRRDPGPLQAALVALDPTSGRILALVGGHDYGSSPLDRAVRARRQPGSAFKPFVYLAALDPARRPDMSARTVVSPLDDSPLAVAAGGHVWRPANYDGVFHGSLPLEDALAQSLNAATARLALDVGLDAVAGAAADLGIPGPLPMVPSLALGVAETSLLDLTAAYGVFASGGIKRPADLVVAIASSAGETLYAARAEETRVLDPGVAYLVTHLLERVVDTGTARAARRAGIDGTAAGKTGTTDDTRDAWFIGFTPEVIAGVWVGFDDGAPTGFTGAEGALPIWIDFVRATAGPGAGRPFEVPDDIVWRDVDPSSGLLATSGCPEVRHEPFLAGTEPQRPCDRHRAVWTAVGEGLGDALRGGGRAIGAGGRRMFGWVGRLFR